MAFNQHTHQLFKMIKLSKGQYRILAEMAKNKDTDEGELVYEKGLCYLGCNRVDGRIFFGLLRLCAISADQYSDNIGEGVERYRINETGQELLDNQPFNMV